MAYLFIGKKATEVRDHNDTIKAYNKRISDELRTDETYASQLTNVNLLYTAATTLGNVLSTENEVAQVEVPQQIEQIDGIKSDIVKLYEELYGVHIEKHKVINTYSSIVENGIDKLKDMCQELNQELPDQPITDISSDMQSRIDAIKVQINNIIYDNKDAAIENYNRAFDDFYNEVHEYDEAFDTYKTNVNTALQTYSDAEIGEVKEAAGLAFNAAVDSYVLPELPEDITPEQAEIIAANITEYQSIIKSAGTIIANLTFTNVDLPTTYEYGGEGDYQTSAEQRDGLDENGEVYEYGQDEAISEDEGITDEAYTAETVDTDKAHELLDKTTIEKIKEMSETAEDDTTEPSDDTAEQTDDTTDNTNTSEP